MNKKIQNLLPYGMISSRLKSNEFFGDEAKDIPELYNSRGEKYKIFYLKNSLNAHTPYSMVAGRISDRILWDRFNQGLPVHFYNHQDMLDTSRFAQKKFGVLRESEAIVPEDYKIIMNNPGLAGEFTHIFTHNEEILNKYSNASFVPAYGVWYGTKLFGGTMTGKAFESKEKEISFISSDKAISEYHKIRISLAQRYKDHKKIDGFGKAFNNYVKYKADALESYRYSIVIENGSSPYYFTEKILDCFASMTIPIYLGATRIDDFFNTDGIITISKDNLENLDKVLESCCKEDYESRLEAIKDNYQRVQKYLSFEDYLLDNYEKMFE